MDNEEIQRLLNRVLSLDPLEKNNFYHALLTIVRKNSDPNRAAGDIIIEFDELLEQKRVKLDAILNGNPTNAPSSPGKPSPIFRRVS